MGIRANYTDGVLDDFLTQAMIIIKDEIVSALSFLGEKSVAHIRKRNGRDSWFDQTGNLRSSIGYIVADHGRKQIVSAFAQVKNGVEGTSVGRRLVEELASKYTNTYALIVVAGMDYADYVEAMDNKDVLASEELWARSQIDGYLEKAKKKASKRIQNLYV